MKAESLVYALSDTVAEVDSEQLYDTLSDITAKTLVEVLHDTLAKDRGRNNL